MEGFTLALALVDAIPVIAFGISMGIIGSRFPHPLFIVGASLSILAGCCKVAWKLILGISKKDIRWLNKPFVPLQATGFLVMLISFILGFARIDWSGVLAGITGIPSISSISFINTDPPLPLTSSIMFRATIIGMSSSSSCIVR